MGSSCGRDDGFTLAIATGFTKVEMETDSLSVVKAIIGNEVGRCPWNLLVDDVGCLVLSFACCNVLQVKRGVIP